MISAAAIIMGVIVIPRIRTITIHRPTELLFFATELSGAL